MPEDGVNNTIGMIPVLAQSIKKDVDAARTHLNNHVREEEILTLDRNCEYCQIYFKE
ncbi:MAG TPA: hypothetical protein VFY68_07265 [Nitrososphaeraceae archaeon]|jgi:hypothetical protein|nr:hypothetical protein [Nitrososphaeraceae archaeon]